MLGPLIPAFRTLLDALPARPSGRRFDVQVISDEDVEPLNDPRTFWQVIKLEWLARKA